MTQSSLYSQNIGQSYMRELLALSKKKERLGMLDSSYT